MTRQQTPGQRCSASQAELLDRDLDQILAVSEGDLRCWSQARLYVTGGTGFVGKWLLHAFARANRTLLTNIRLDILTRDPERFCLANRELAADGNFRFLRGDVTAPVSDGVYDGVIHAAATSSIAVSPGETMRTIVDGTRTLIREVISPSGVIPVLFMSSGAIYGRALFGKSGTPEEYQGELDHLDLRFAYHESKRLAELSFAIAGAEGKALPRIARLFAFLGPGLPLDAHFAAGNFIRDAMNGGPILINGGGNSTRSYLYPTDLIAWCLAVFNRGATGRAYNVGSDQAVSIRELAARTSSAVTPKADVRFRGPADSVEETSYVPDIKRIKRELGVRRAVDLDDAIARTIRFYLASRDST